MRREAIQWVVAATLIVGVFFGTWWVEGGKEKLLGWVAGELQPYIKQEQVSYPASSDWRLVPYVPPQIPDWNESLERYQARSRQYELETRLRDLEMKADGNSFYYR